MTVSHFYRWQAVQKAIGFSGFVLIGLSGCGAGPSDPSGGGMVGTTIEAEALDASQSSGYSVLTSETDPGRQYVGYFDTGGYICYADIDLTGVRSIELEYAKGMEEDESTRFAILIDDNGARVPLGEKITTTTDGWETFRSLRVGLSQQASGRHRLCFVGLTGGGIFNLDRFTLSDQPGENDGITERFEMSTVVLSAAGHEFSLQKVAEIPGELWAMDFLPDNTIVATQKNGTLWIIKEGARVGAVEGIPEVWHSGQGGLLEVKRHPDYANNRWLYLTYSHPGPGGAMTRVVRGQLDGLKWVNEQVIYTAPTRFYTDSVAHFGSRLVFQDGYVFFSIGERGEQDLAQDLTFPNGKIHRLHADGKVPQDNPFVAQSNAQPSIWSYGHRNPQGLTVHPATGDIWAAEHGPMGGDEINVVQKGLNYGWPLVSFGKNYDGTPISDRTQQEGMESPKHHWTPSIAVSDIAFYTGDRFPGWRNHLLVGSLARQELRLVRVQGTQVIGDELLLQGRGRIREISDGPDGYPYVIFNSMIYRLVPANQNSSASAAK